VTWERLAAAWPLIRDVLCVVVALGGLVFEATRSGDVRPELVLAWVGLLGSPVFLRKDEKDKGDRPEPTPREADR
jgi:hypothetical protein